MLNKHEMYKEKVKYTLDKNKNNYEVNEENKNDINLIIIRKEVVPRKVVD